ncbi:hypothetical protein [Microbacterium sp. NIBRBAC000506063]|uniref:hypothetical protein n=1 Tax=Microbacterium sp. NIBRBAC000506063 TaxID=2734618 RepID=UPI001BB700D3|nr:hypothetical protein [Microbacterium sp. NIBRBAC000506063]QTV80392.1 hypothetical protein KAE78_05525 [Microbacterium sp. NIBRBAC000506063]
MARPPRARRRPSRCRHDRCELPLIVAASAIGKRSRDQVFLLHGLGMSTTHEDGIPQDLIPAQAEQVGTDLLGLIQEATMIEPPAGTPAALLVESLTEYAELAEELADWTADDEALSSKWFDALGEADDSWTQALRELSELSGEDLLDDMPELLLPDSP